MKNQNANWVGLAAIQAGIEQIEKKGVDLDADECLELEKSAQKIRQLIEPSRVWRESVKNFMAGLFKPGHPVRS